MKNSLLGERLSTDYKGTKQSTLLYMARKLIKHSMDV